MKVLFLDIDGVLNHDTTTERVQDISDSMVYNLVGVDTILLDRYLNWISDKDILVVLSSMWRYHENMKDNLIKRGISWKDETPKLHWSMGDDAGRGNEVAMWLGEHPETVDYAILDDIQWFLPEQQNHLVLTNPKVGLTDEDLVQVEKILDLYD